MMRGRLPATAAILAGDRLSPVDGRNLRAPEDAGAAISLAARGLEEIVAHTMVVTERPEAVLGSSLPKGVLQRADVVPHRGPLAGLVTALMDAPDDWVLALSAFAPPPKEGVVRALWESREGADVVVPVGASGREPLLALYSRACLDAARRSLESGRRRLVGFYRDVRVVEVPLESLFAVDPGLRDSLGAGGDERRAAVRPLVFGASAEPAGSMEADEADSALPVQSAGGETAGRSKGTSSDEAGAGSGRRAPDDSRTLRVVDLTAGDASRELPRERAVTVFLNDKEIVTLQATPEDLEELAAGFLVGEGFIVERDALVALDSDRRRGLVWVETSEAPPDDSSLRSRVITSGCGKGVTFSSIGHAKALAPIESEARVDARSLRDMMSGMSRAATAYRKTGGMHACALAPISSLEPDADALGPAEHFGLLVHEDVGRHNAMDKVLGRAWLDRLSTKSSVLLTSGRISYEMAVKAAKAAIPIVVSRTAVTDMASQVGSTLGITLVGYARRGALTVYTHSRRILLDQDRPREEMTPRTSSEDSDHE